MPFDAGGRKPAAIKSSSKALDISAISIILIVLLRIPNRKAPTMLRKISAVKVRQNLGEVMNEVALRGDDYIIERAGKPLVAIIPMEKYRKLQKDFEDFYADVKAFQKDAKGVDSKVVDKAIEEAIAAAKAAPVKSMGNSIKP
jgi:prevent-host-death family protein